MRALPALITLFQLGRRKSSIGLLLRTLEAASTIACSRQLTDNRIGSLLSSNSFLDSGRNVSLFPAASVCRFESNVIRNMLLSVLCSNSWMLSSLEIFFEPFCDSEASLARLLALSVGIADPTGLVGADAGVRSRPNGFSG